MGPRCLLCYIAGIFISTENVNMERDRISLNYKEKLSHMFQGSLYSCLFLGGVCHGIIEKEIANFTCSSRFAACKGVSSSSTLPPYEMVGSPCTVKIGY